jgi:vacuolar-type H+-ATPase subunit D/Vma8
MFGINTLKRENEDLKDTNDVFKSGIKLLKQKNALLEREIKDLEEKVNNYFKEISSLKEENKYLNSKLKAKQFSDDSRNY